LLHVEDRLVRCGRLRRTRSLCGEALPIGLDSASKSIILATALEDLRRGIQAPSRICSVLPSAAVSQSKNSEVVLGDSEGRVSIA
jgi:hypothetical protein